LVVVSTDTQVIPLPVASANDAGPFAMVLAEVRALRAEVQAQRQELQELRHQVGAPPPVSVPVEDAARRLGCARTQVFKLLCRGQLQRGKSVGRRTMISVASLEALQVGDIQPQPRRRTAQPRRAQAQAQELAAAIRDLRI
jgi:hypothetical protein